MCLAIGPNRLSACLGSLARIRKCGLALHLRHKINWSANKVASNEKDGFVESTSSSLQSQQNKLGESTDFILGLAIRRSLTGYALLNFADLQPLQFGIIDIQKSEEMQQKAMEINAVLRELRDGAPQKLERVIDEVEPLKRKSKKDWRWIVSIDDSTVDRSAPVNRKESTVQRGISMLQGLVLADCKRLFKVAPLLVHPRKSRQFLGVRGTGPDARKEILEIATSRVSDFPTIKNHNGKVLIHDTLLMSDAWAAARYSQRMTLVAQMRDDTELLSKLRQDIMKSKQLRRMNDAVEELYPRQAGRDLAKVLQTRVEKLIDDRIHKLLDHVLEHGSKNEVETTVTAKGPHGSTTKTDEGHLLPTSL